MANIAHWLVSIKDQDWVRTYRALYVEKSFIILKGVLQG